MRIDSLRRHVEKGGTRGKCKGISLAHLPVRAKSKKGLAHTKVRTPVPTNAALEESVSPPSHFSTLPTILRDPRSPGTDATRGSGLDARVAAAVSNPSLAPSPYVTSIHLPDLRLRVNTTVPRPDKSALSPISSSRDRYASPLPRSRPTASPRSCRSPFGGTRELFSSPLSGPPSLLLDTPASRNQSLWSPNTPFTPMLAFGASPNSFQTLPSLEDDDLLPPLKNLPESVDESAPSVFVQGLGLEDPPYPPFNAIDQHWDYSQAASPSPYGNPIALPVQPPQTSSIPTPQIQLQDVQTFHPQPSDPFRKLAPVRLHYGNFQGSQGWTASQSNEASSSSGYYHAQRTEYLPPGFLQNLPAYNFPEAPAPVVTQMAAPAMPSAAPSDYTAFQRERPPHHEFDIYDMTMDEHLQMQINGI
ncbi:hypothetical protein BDV98DRAFT_2072 [Pterulicium gracile]|uniref:Uncharacterized protein n=1 Tax=Pterulicium gracile TaxID=1884261 RepID=A0A5C3R1B0_9AGAR|nr:hypothetical protein BDV98DRAFT_2072 [Pterula gracilis]